MAKKNYKIGEIFRNPYLGNKITEILNLKNARVGWIWTTQTGRIIVSPNLGTYIWEGENGAPWTMNTGALWLISARKNNG
tara:strand:- start:11683 stop:11922 length:240 start_codon:yes stop_codon:yes gene_type:complete